MTDQPPILIADLHRIHPQPGDVFVYEADLDPAQTDALQRRWQAALPVPLIIVQPGTLTHLRTVTTAPDPAELLDDEPPPRWALDRARRLAERHP